MRALPRPLHKKPAILSPRSRWDLPPPAELSFPVPTEVEGPAAVAESGPRIATAPRLPMRAALPSAAQEASPTERTTLFALSPPARAADSQAPAESPWVSPSPLERDRKPAPSSPVVSVSAPRARFKPPPVELCLPTETEPPREPEVPVSIIRGSINDASTGRPLDGASVLLDLPRGESQQVSSGSDGSFELTVTDVPDFFALSASHPGYVPESINLSRQVMRNSRLIVEFRLQPQTVEVLVVEEAPEVHHLGNDRFEGRINSRFQKESEGDTFVGEFELTAAQLAEGVDGAEIRLLAKGAQCRNRVRINGTRLRRPLTNSPRDGSFGELVIPLDPSLLQLGRNVIRIEATTCGSDLDDFEFVNIRILLSSQAAGAEESVSRPPDAAIPPGAAAG